MIRHVAVVPSTPLVLPDHPGRSHPAMVDLARSVGRVLEGAAAQDTIIVLAGGQALRVVDPVPTDLSGYGQQNGVRGGSPACPAAPALLVAGLRALVGIDGQTNGSAVDLTVIGRLLPPGPGVIGLTVPADIGQNQASRLGRGLWELVGGGGAVLHVAVVVAGDLSAGHGNKPPRPPATGSAYDQLVVAALDNGRPADLLGADAALVADSHARAAGALRVLGGLLEHLRFATVVRHAGAPLGVGYVVAQGG